jgi:hypothetical protein
MNTMHTNSIIPLLLAGTCVSSPVDAAEPPRTGIGIDGAPGDCRGVDLQGLLAPPVALLYESGKAIVTGRAAGHVTVTDWNDDGVPDYVHPTNRYEWTVHAGRRRPAGGVTP